MSPDPTAGDPTQRLDDPRVLQRCGSVAEFSAAVRERAIGRVVLAYRDEYGPADDGSGQATYTTVREITLLAYDRGLLVSCEAHDQVRSTLKALLESQGLVVEERSRNLTTAPPPQDARNPPAARVRP